MFVYMGKYRNHFNFTVVYDKFFEKYPRLERFTDAIVQPIIETIWNSWYPKLSRPVFVSTKPYDVWNADHTLALIALPLVKRLKTQKQGAPLVDNEDVPMELWRDPSTEAQDTDKNWFKRWDYVIDEIIFALEIEAASDSESKFYHNEQNDEESYTPIRDPGEEGSLGDTHFYVDYEGMTEEQERVKKGLCLLGKYWQGLWD